MEQIGNKRQDGRLKHNHIDNYFKCEGIINTWIKRQKISHWVKKQESKKDYLYIPHTCGYETDFKSKDTDYLKVKD